MAVTRKRSMSAALGAAALGAAAACPTANAAQANAPATPAAAHHAKPHRRPTSHRGAYVYRATIGAEVSVTGNNMFCSGSAIRFVGVNVDPEPGDRAETLWERAPSSWKRHFTLRPDPTRRSACPGARLRKSAKPKNAKATCPTRRAMGDGARESRLRRDHGERRPGQRRRSRRNLAAPRARSQRQRAPRAVPGERRDERTRGQLPY